MNNPTGQWTSQCIVDGWSGVLAQSRESDPWEVWSLGLVLSSGQSVPTPTPHRKRNGGGSFDADLGGIEILPREDQSGGWRRQAGSLGHPGHREKGEMSAHRQEQRGPSGLDHGRPPWTPTKPAHLLPTQATQQGEPHYANLELQMWPLRGEPVHPRQAEVEYSTVVSARAWLPHGGPGLC